MRTIFQLPPAIRHATLTSFLPVQNYSLRRFSSTLPTVTSSTGRSYAEAIALLDSLQSNRAVVSSISDSSRDMNLNAIPEMLEWARKAGYGVSDFAKLGLRCIHVAGTKGKGSVCAMVENILLQYRRADDGALRSVRDRALGKIGLYTSPHLITVRERIRIDGVPISESLFTRYFFELWDRFSFERSSNPSDLKRLSVGKPSYFRYLTLLALHTFVNEGVETAIVECGIGGEYDSTNILPREAVTVSAITKLGIDHVGMLGDTVEKIAMHKAGIMKKGIPAYTVEQIPGAQTVLESCAVGKGAELHVIRRNPQLEDANLKLSIEGQFQKDNASLAIAVAASHLQSMGVTNGAANEDSKKLGKLSPQFARGLETTKLPGRCEVRKDGNIEWLIDGAHTIDSLESTAHWYLNKLENALRDERLPTATMLIFNQQDRDAQGLIRSFLGVLAGENPQVQLELYTAQDRLQKMRFSAHRKMFTYAAFCTNIPFQSDVPENIDLQVQIGVAAAYQSIASNSLNMCYGSVEEAVELARKVSEGDERVLVLVTGSLHLVGALLQVLERESRRPP
ncbi:Folylpoly-gamma-glutamate synthetase [Hyphodiscus hymeniophilus]|uniref:Folylpolyglutamate synthase n=1 Tax=Hyphodiscus hymeniophilus TaxID=353542 RepID=A0A9P6SQ74_9HELO|nr:Folylpoly-gamma-glutamate synthetase [Hyphodiscus hymeniophilus]